MKYFPMLLTLIMLGFLRVVFSGGSIVKQPISGRLKVLTRATKNADIVMQQQHADIC